MNLSQFDTSIYSEELHNVSESDYNEVMSLIAEESTGFDSYSEWSLSLESPVVNESENFIATADGKVYHRPEPKSNGRYQGIEI
jgi:hypothetical protein